MYYPASQIKTNLYTNGTELVYKSNNQKYIGYYFKTSDGKYFSGKTPDDKISVELIFLSQFPQTEQSEVIRNIPEYSQVNLNSNSSLSNEYNKLNNNLQTVKKLPTSCNPQPTEEDYKFGEFKRYFVKKNNESIFIEINQDTYNKLIDKNSEYLWQLYTPFKFSWKLTGEKNDVYRINKGVVETVIFKPVFPIFEQYLKKDYLKFWKA